MLTHRQVAAIACALWTRLGETALPAAMLRAYQAEQRGDDVRFTEWRRVASMLERLALPQPAA